MSGKTLALFFRVLLALAPVAALLAPTSARAHAGGLAVFVSLDPVQPQPGRPATLTAEALDAYNNPIAGLKVQAGVAPPGRQPGALTPLRETAPGRYQGEVTFPAGGSWWLALVADAPVGRYQGGVLVTIGPQGDRITGIGLDLHPESSSSRTLAWLSMAAVAGVWVVGGGLRLRWIRRSRRSGPGAGSTGS